MSSLLASDDQNTGASASASLLPVNIQSLSPLSLTGLVSLLSKGLSGLCSSTTVQRHQFFGFCFLCGPTLTIVCDHWENHGLDYTDLCRQSNVSAFQHTSRFVIAFLPGSKCLLISWLQSPSTVILKPRKRKSVTTSTLSPFYLPCSVPCTLVEVDWKGGKLEIRRPVGRVWKAFN